MNVLSRIVSRLNGFAEAAAAQQAAIAEFLRMSYLNARTLSYAAELMFRQTYNVPDGIAANERKNWPMLVSSLYREDTPDHLSEDERGWWLLAVNGDIQRLKWRVEFYSVLHDAALAIGPTSKHKTGKLPWELKEMLLALGPSRFGLDMIADGKINWERVKQGLAYKPDTNYRWAFDAYGSRREVLERSATAPYARLDFFDDVVTNSLIEAMPYEAGQLAEAVGFKYLAKLAPIVGEMWCEAK